ncbi:hypothetical protein ASG63_13390 [Methylobacterium sp. Leaf94]|uniref:exosortase/archaeosortase family protein n=1 Tax=Methylobacterium sp. Leaf94 TaxID=1736250 RepID=UPI0006FFAF3A|nr:exosortase/archaeosortase family protein [Methylobacterium sp. Leaf94]KQU34030.1 hypothetical protein ASG63_13390 [Methylobacterium sp. Leaf94]
MRIGLGFSASRSAYLCAFMAICAANGLAGRMLQALEAEGWVVAGSRTFDISAIVWLGIVCGIALAFTDRGGSEPMRGDVVVLGIAAPFVLAPSSALAWVTLTAIALWTLATSSGRLARGAAILLVVTMPMCWTRLLFNLAAPYILSADALMVATILGTESSGNLVASSNGQTYLQIYPACSSLGNVSLALLGWVIAINVVRPRARRNNMLWGALACCSVVAINILRLAAIGLLPEHFELLHGAVGNSVTSWLTLAAIGAVCWAGVRARPSDPVAQDLPRQTDTGAAIR